VISKEELQQFGIESPKLYIGDIASGDQFISDVVKKHQLRDEFPELLCVEMEGAAVVQVCYEFNIPFTIIRTISDCADQHAEINFLEFVKEVANKYSREIILRLV
jgi:adenosylhomocysteine nucleosidase